MENIVAPNGEWAAAAGAALVAFGTIEHTTVVCLREIPSDSIWRFSKSLKLVPRIDLLGAGTAWPLPSPNILFSSGDGT